MTTTAVTTIGTSSSAAARKVTRLGYPLLIGGPTPQGSGTVGMSEKSNTINAVFYADTYHPIQAGSIDGTDVLPHDSAVCRAILCSSAGLYDPHGDPKVIGDPYCTLFVGRLARHTDEETLRKAMSRYGRVKNLRLVRDIVTGASRGYAFVEYETEREMRRAYKDAHHSFIDDSEIIVDYNRQQLMPGWIPRRLGGGLGGRKESGQLRFGGRERPFRAPLRPIPYEDLKRLRIPPPPEGHYMSRFQKDRPDSQLAMYFQIPSPPRRSSPEGEDTLPKRRRHDDREELSPRRRRRHSYREDSPTRKQRSSRERDDHDGSSRRKHKSSKEWDDHDSRHHRHRSEHHRQSTRDSESKDRYSDS